MIIYGELSAVKAHVITSRVQQSDLYCAYPTILHAYELRSRSPDRPVLDLGAVYILRVQYTQSACVRSVFIVQWPVSHFHHVTFTKHGRDAFGFLPVRPSVYPSVTLVGLVMNWWCQNLSNRYQFVIRVFSLRRSVQRWPTNSHAHRGWQVWMYRTIRNVSLYLGI